MGVYDRYGGLLVVELENGRYTYTDTEGRRVFEEEWKDASHFREGLAVVVWNEQHLRVTSGREVLVNEERWGYINPQGERAFERTFAWAGDFGVLDENLAKVQYDNDRWGLIRRNGTDLLKTSFVSINRMQKGFAEVELDGGRIANFWYSEHDSQERCLMKLIAEDYSYWPEIAESE
ncbi:WG repeat-containing protein [Microgenomates group bacterium]|nr:WG repeat-containing protein [Microgenomates group bacterium]